MAAMSVRSKLKPGQRGAKHLTHLYGDRLLCVRYRYDEESLTRYTTVELIVAQEPWRPQRRKPDSIVQVRVAFDEVDLRQKVKEAGGRWNKNKKLWELPFKTAQKLGLRKRIADQNGDSRGE